MAHARFGARSIEWWKHLRWQKRPQEKLNRRATKKQIKEETA